MMNKMKSARVQIIRFLFVLPLIAVLLLAFREVKLQERNHAFWQPAALLNDTVPPDNIKSVNVTKNNGENSVRIVLKDGTVENYNLNDAKEKAAFEKKYGELKPPPPPPAPSTIGTVTNSKEIETVDVTKKDGKNTVSIRLKNGTIETYDLNDPKQKETLEKKYGISGTTPPPPPPPAETPAVISPAKEQLTPNEKGYYLTIADNNGECVVIIKDKKKKIVEALTLTDWNKKESFYKSKYGDIPPPPPPAVSATVSVAAPVSIATTVSPVNKVTVALAPTVKLTGVKSNVAVVSEVSTLSPVTATVQVAPVSVESKLTMATSPSPAALVETKGKTLSITTANPNKVLYYIDGKEATIEEVNQLNPDQIESINVLKGNDATKAYGDKGKNGVILIKTKIKTAKRNLQIDDKVNAEPAK